MAGNKRSWEGNVVEPAPKDTVMAEDEPTQTSPVISMFTTIRGELDEHHDRRERVIKASRDITALSKKVIFSLHRVRSLNAPIPKSVSRDNDERFSQIDGHFKSIAADISGINAWRYQYQISGGIQEYIEALSFDYYLRNKALIPLEVVRQSIPDILVTETDYVLGLFDLTGEMMRFAITSMTMGAAANAGVDGEGGQAATPTDTIMVDLRELRAMFETLNVPRNHGLSKEAHKKTEVMQASVEKVERAAYGMLVRGSERPEGWMPDLSSAGPVESY